MSKPIPNPGDQVLVPGLGAGTVLAVNRDLVRVQLKQEPTDIDWWPTYEVTWPDGTPLDDMHFPDDPAWT